MNILLTSVGKREYLIRYFRKALDHKGEIYVANSTPVAAFKEADRAFVSPGIYEESYLPFLLQLCKEQRIRAILPLFDLDVLVLSHHKEEFERIGTTLIVSDPEVVELCQDKWKCFRFMREHNIKTPETWQNLYRVIREVQSFDAFFPFVIKPRMGMGTIGFYDNIQTMPELRVLYLRSVAETRKALEDYKIPSAEIERMQGTLIQERINGQEYSLDVICDLVGNYCNTVVKKKLKMQAGETQEAEVVENQALKDLGKRLALLLRPVGNLDVDVIVQSLTGEPYVIEINPRLGGGFPYTYISGVDLPEAIIYWLEKQAGERLDPGIPESAETCRCGHGQGAAGEDGKQLHLEETPGILAQKVILPEQVIVPQDILIRRTSEETRIREALYRLEDSLMPPLSQRGIDVAAYAHKLVENALVWVACDRNEEIIGLIAVYIKDKTDSKNTYDVRKQKDMEGAKDAGEISAGRNAYGTFFAIDRAYRGLHIGKRLFHTMLQELEAGDIQYLDFEVRSRNLTALRMYLGEGCEIREIRGEGVYLMRMPIEEQNRKKAS